MRNGYFLIIFLLALSFVFISGCDEETDMAILELLIFDGMGYQAHCNVKQYDETVWEGDVEVTNNPQAVEVELKPGDDYGAWIDVFNNGLWVFSDSSTGISLTAGETTTLTYQVVLLPVPEAPSNLSAEPVSTSEISLTWTDNSDNEDGFIIERRTTEEASFSSIDSVEANVTEYNDTGLTPCTEYHYQVCAYNLGGNSDYTDVANATTPSDLLEPPSNLIAEAVSSSEIKLDWTDNSDVEDGFIIERKTAEEANFSLLDSVDMDTTNYSDTGLAENSEYHYRVYAYCDIGNSSYSNEASATTLILLEPPEAPTNLSAVFSNNITLTWEDNSDNEVGFKIERKTGASGIFEQLTDVVANETTYEDASFTPGEVYYYRVKAYNAGGDSDYSNEASIQALGFLGTYNTPGKAMEVAVSGGYAFVADSSEGVRIIDVSVPSNPQEVTDINFSLVYGVAIAGDYIFIADAIIGIVVFDISDPLNSFEETRSTLAGARGIEISGDFAYVPVWGETYGSMYIYDISDPTDLSEKGSVEFTGQVNDLAVSGGYAYAAIYGQGLQVVDVSSPSLPINLGFYNDLFALGVDVTGNYAYLTNGGTVKVLDVSIPTNPTLSGTYSEHQYAKHVTVVGDRLFVPDWNGLKLWVVDISSPTNPQTVRYFETQIKPFDAFILEDTAYIAGYTEGMAIILVGQ